MLILTLRTERPEAEIGLYQDGVQLGYITWQADRQLAETLHQKINSLLKAHQSSIKDLQAIVVFKGPGSFTGLRIGISVANALAYGLSIPIIGSRGTDWIATGLHQLSKGENEQIVVPEYGSLPHITKPKK